MNFENHDFGLRDDSGYALFVGDTVHIKTPGLNYEKTVTLEFNDGVFGFKSDDTQSHLIPIAWHIGASNVKKIIKT